MSTLRISNIEAKADASSPTINEKLKFTSSPSVGQDPLLHLDGLNAASGITTIGINTTGNTITVRGNDLEVAGIVTTGDIKIGGIILDDAKLPDNKKVILGTGNDFQIYHSSSDNNSYIKESGSGNLNIQGTHLNLMSTAGEFFVDCVENLNVNLRFNNNVKLSTVTTGVKITGICSVTNPFFINGQTVDDDYTLPTGKNAGTFGPVTVAATKVVTIPSGSYWTIV